MTVEMMPLFRKRTRTWKGTQKGVHETTQKDCSDLPCGTNAECEVQHPSYVCKCPSGYSGDPYVNCTVNCTKHGTCGTNAECESKDTHTICNCLSGHKGDPYTGKEWL